MKKWICWLLAIVITLALSVYQRMTGPTNPKRVTVELDGESYPMKWPRSGVREDKTTVLEKGLDAEIKSFEEHRKSMKPQIGN